MNPGSQGEKRSGRFSPQQHSKGGCLLTSGRGEACLRGGARLACTSGGCGEDGGALGVKKVDGDPASLWLSEVITGQGTTQEVFLYLCSEVPRFEEAPPPHQGLLIHVSTLLVPLAHPLRM